MFRFTIRDVLWLTVVAALVAGWWIDHWRADQRYKRVEQVAYNLLMFQDPEGKGYVTFPDGTRWPPLD